MFQQRSPALRAHRPALASRLWRVACLALPLAFAACSSTDTRQLVADPSTFFNDASFEPSTAPLDPADIFRLTPEMQAYLDEQILPAARSRGMREALIDALYKRGKLRLEYEASLTRNASEAFEARQGNCLSLVIMTGAFAKAMGLDITFQQVNVDDAWSRSGDLYFMSGHVNLQLEHRLADSLARSDRFAIYTIDFLPAADTAGLRVRAIKEDTVRAMYMNNRAAEALAIGQVDNAYWRVREAVRLDPGFISAYNTLGVIYLRHGDAAHAHAVLQAALAHSPQNPRILANDAQALHRLGLEAEAQALQKRLTSIEPYPPFFFYNRGETALKANDFATARAMFKRELDREPDYHEFHYALAVADFGLGRLDEARSELAIALENAVRRTDHDLYAAKLDRLKSYRHWTPAGQSNLQ